MSTLFLMASSWSFFICLSCHGITASNYTPWFPATKPQVAKHPLTLAHTHIHAIDVPCMMGQQLPIPVSLGIAKLFGKFTNIPSQFIVTFGDWEKNPRLQEKALEPISK